MIGIRTIEVRKTGLAWLRLHRQPHLPNWVLASEQSRIIRRRKPVPSWQASDPHHLRFAQPRALGLKVSDEFTVPLCRGHHRQLHQAGNEVAWWENLKINALEIAKGLWEESHKLQVPAWSL